jgi:small GTP-binding protein
MAASTPEPKIKLLLLGHSGAGKTSLLMRHTKQCFSPTFITTIGIDFVPKRTLVGSQWYRAVWWDTAGQERFRSISASYIKGAQGILIVFDVMDPASFADLKVWLSDVRKAGDAQVLVAANKCDADEADWQVTRREAEEWCAAQRVPIHFVSARTGAGVDAAFESLVALVAQSKPSTTTNPLSTISLHPKRPHTSYSCACSH